MRLNLQWIDVVQVAHVGNKKIRVQADKSLRLDEVLAGEKVVAFGLKVLQKFFLFSSKEIIDRLNVRLLDSTAQALLHR